MSEPDAPTVEIATDGTFFARVEDKNAAVKASKTMQRELGLQLEELGAESGSVQMIAFQYGQGKPKVPSNAMFALAPGEFTSVSKTVTLCAVEVGSGN